MSSTCRSRRSTKSIPGILLPRSCLAQSVAAKRQRVRQRGGERGGGASKQCGAMQRLIGCSLWTHAANSNAIAAQQSKLQLESLSLSLARSGEHELATPPHNGPQAQAESRARTRVGVRVDTHSALEIGKLFSLLDWRRSWRRLRLVVA